jgi:ABC-type sugar transport system ATPase subunit
VDALSKSFGGVQALECVSLRIARGACHALIGENGAGKSTLGKILAGIHTPDAGTLRLDGVVRRFRSPRDALRCGVSMVHQELAFCPDLSVAENLCLGQYPRRRGGWLDLRAMHARAEQLLGEIQVAMDVRRPMRELNTGQEQLVQIAAAVGAGARLILFDEPTSSLAEAEARRLFDLIARLRRRGVTMIYISHRLPEVLALCDHVTVLRDGSHIATLPRAEVDSDHLVQLMIGRRLADPDPMHGATAPGAVRLRVENLRSRHRFHGVSFEVRAGEIVGLAGLVGAGRSEVARAIFGLDPAAEGLVEVNGTRVAPGSPRRAMRLGLGLVPEDRKRQGLVTAMSCRHNFSLGLLDRLHRWGFLRHDRERREAARLFAQLRVKMTSLDVPAAALSGGNQQKVVLAKWLARDLKIWILDEPTRGVDVGAKEAIHHLIRALAGRGLAVLLISSELPELLQLSTRILVMRAGRLTAEVPRARATQAELLRQMAGVPETAPHADTAP